ncbi:TlpA family protein disulfide reductase [Radiobacillus sp. PE A8.2]|uniref:TlpA family protein disulfide reductase n=1 Tax=Radiobacillus sp. PE A8.2 TaxID=3380349 RepID=UPI00388F3F9C
MKAPFFQLPYINKQSVYNSEDDLGKVLMITFWVSWCSDCGVDLPKKEQLFQSINTDQVKMITINVTGRERDSQAGSSYTDKFLKQSTLADRGREVYDQFDCTGVPTTVLLDRNGIVHKQFGDKADFMEILQTLGELLKK